MKSLRRAWQDMGIWGWAGLVLIAACLALTPSRGPITIDWITHEEKSLVGQSIVLQTRGLIGTGQPLAVRVDTQLAGPLSLSADGLSATDIVPGEVIRVSLPACSTGRLVLAANGSRVVWSLGRDRPRQAPRC